MEMVIGRKPLYVRIHFVIKPIKLVACFQLLSFGAMSSIRSSFARFFVVRSMPSSFYQAPALEAIFIATEFPFSFINGPNSISLQATTILLMKIIGRLLLLLGALAGRFNHLQK